MYAAPSLDYIYTSASKLAGTQRYGYVLTREYHTSSVSTWDVDMLNTVNPGYNIGSANNGDTSYLLGAQYTSVGIETGGSTFGGETFISSSPNSSTADYQVSVSLSGGGSGLDDWQYTVGKSNNEVTTQSQGDGITYGAWNTHWIFGSNSSEGTYTISPGIRCQNTYGTFDLSTDRVLSVTNNNSQSALSTGNLWDTISVSDF